LKAAVHKNSQTGFWLLFLQQARCCCAWLLGGKKAWGKSKDSKPVKKPPMALSFSYRVSVSIFILGLRCVGVPNALPMLPWLAVARCDDVDAASQ